jgi:DNA-binding response OmpR family regulator
LGNNKKVLVIDDDAQIRRVVELKLRKRGYDVVMAMNGEEGLQVIESEKPDAVVTDIMMPKLDGETLCKQTNHLKKQRPFLTIVMTNRISPDDRNWVKDMQDTQLMEKPFSPTRLLGCIDEYFHRSES